jgi:hypothetical protein
LLKSGAHQTGNASEGSLLILPGDLDPRNINAFISKTGSGPYLVTFGFTAASVAPSVGAPYKIQGCNNVNYNGVYNATASTTSTITLSYNNDPGSYSNLKPVKISSVLTETVRAQYLNYAQNIYQKAIKTYLKEKAKLENEIKTLKENALKTKMNEDTLKSRIVDIKGKKYALMVLVKTDDKAKYKNVIDIIDELNICLIGKYALVDLDTREYDLINNFQPGQ